MRKDLLIIALGLFSFAGTAAAEALAMPEASSTPPPAAEMPAMTLPAKGTSMAEVKKKLGEPAEKHAPAGGDTPKHPPITRWDYAGFSLFFEKDKLIDSVVPGAPAKVVNKDQLKPIMEPAMPPADAAPAAAEANPAPPPEPEAPAAMPPPAAAPAPAPAPASPPPSAPQPMMPGAAPEDAPPTPK